MVYYDAAISLIIYIETFKATQLNFEYTIIKYVIWGRNYKIYRVRSNTNLCKSGLNLSQLCWLFGNINSEIWVGGADWQGCLAGEVQGKVSQLSWYRKLDLLALLLQLAAILIYSLIKETFFCKKKKMRFQESYKFSLDW